MKSPKYIYPLLSLLVISGALFQGCEASTSTTTTTSTQQTSTPSVDSTISALAPTSTQQSINPQPVATSPSTTTTPTTTTTIKPVTPTVSATSAYKDGTYTENASYVSPAGTENVVVKFVLANDVITNVDMTNSSPASPMSSRFENLFLSGIQQQIVGMKLSNLGTFDRVNGSSLTSSAFNDAVAQVKVDAKA